MTRGPPLPSEFSQNQLVISLLAQIEPGWGLIQVRFPGKPPKKRYIISHKGAAILVASGTVRRQQTASPLVPQLTIGPWHR